MSPKSYLPWFLLIVFAVVVYCIWPSGDVEQNQVIIDANKRIYELETKLSVKEITITKITASRDSAMRAVREKKVADENKIKIKYVNINKGIVELNDDESVMLLKHNLSTRK